MKMVLRSLGWPFSFRGPVSRWVYIPLALVLLFAPQLMSLALSPPAARESLGTAFWIIPQIAFSRLAGQQEVVGGFWGHPAVAMYGEIVAWLLLAWLSVALAFRRAATVGADGWVAALAPIPLFQLLAVGWLCIAPDRRRTPDALASDIPAGLRSRAAVQGALAGAAICIVAVGVGALVFGVYGYAMFVASPFLMGALSAFFANREGDIGGKQTFFVILGGMAFASLGLIGFALEGVVCLAMAFPLTVAAAWIGSLLGRHVALQRRKSSASSAFLSLALLPALFGAEKAFPDTVRFTQQETVIVAASPSAAWRAILKMDRIDEPPALPFRLGLAYPVRGEIIGEGVGATRHGYFSTGVANERITEWKPGRTLGFVILEDAPTLRELSPYAHVHAPHVQGYFRTSHAEFALTPLRDGRTQMTLTTYHELDLQPAGYWMPIVHWAVHENKLRVLGQIRRQAEAHEG